MTLARVTSAPPGCAAIYRGRRAVDVDLQPTSTFTDITGCLESNVPDAATACPATACPATACPATACSSP